MKALTPDELLRPYWPIAVLAFGAARAGDWSAP
jgi:hypothetical protein